MKKAEREEIWDRVNAQAEEVFRDDESMRGFLNFMAQCTPQSTRNLLLLYEQDPPLPSRAPQTDGKKQAGPYTAARKDIFSLPIRNTKEKMGPEAADTLLPRLMIFPRQEGRA